MRGYLNRPQASAEARTADGWIRSGDIGRMDNAGFVYVLDRVKDMTIGIPDERWDEAVKAVVLPAPGAELSADDVIAFCRARLAHYQCPTSVDFVEELPRGATGKVLKRALREPSGPAGNELYDPAGMSTRAFGSVRNFWANKQLISSGHWPDTVADAERLAWPLAFCWAEPRRMRHSENGKKCCRVYVCDRSRYSPQRSQ
jgi:hypothetical protein